MNNFNNIFINFIFILILMFIINKKKICGGDNKLKFNNKQVQDKYNSLTKILGKSTYTEIENNKVFKSATWQTPLDKFNDFGKYNGCDYIKIEGNPVKKYHPHEAIVYLIIGKYIKVPDNLLGPLKYASETINIEQLFVPVSYQKKYAKTGVKDVALVTGSCASITISAITVQFVIDMIEKYKDTTKCLELYDEFRNEYDARINSYLCAGGIKNPIKWYDPKMFNESSNYYMGVDKCKKKQIMKGSSSHINCDEYNTEASCPTSVCIWANNKCNKKAS